MANTTQTTTPNHPLRRGKSRPCVECDYVYGCCKVCNLCKRCHEKLDAPVYELDIRRVAEYQAKREAIHNPGELKPGRFDSDYDPYADY